MMQFSPWFKVNKRFKNHFLWFYLWLEDVHNDGWVDFNIEKVLSSKNALKFSALIIVKKEVHFFLLHVLICYTLFFLSLLVPYFSPFFFTLPSFDPFFFFKFHLILKNAFIAHMAFIANTFFTRHTKNWPSKFSYKKKLNNQFNQNY